MKLSDHPSLDSLFTWYIPPPSLLTSLQYFKLLACELNDHLLGLLLGCSLDNPEEGTTLDGRGQGIGEGVNLNEWGALLLYDQLTALINLIEESALSLVDESIKYCFQSLTLALKIFTLDRPADVKRGGLLPPESDEQAKGRWKSRYPGDHGWYRIRHSDVKRFLRRRIDFSKDVIGKLRLGGGPMSSERTEVVG